MALDQNQRNGILRQSHSVRPRKPLASAGRAALVRERFLTGMTMTRAYILNKLVQLAWLSMIVSAMSASAVAQTYPTKPIRIIVAQAPGSATDVFSRFIGQKLAEALGQPIVIEARPGAGGTLGSAIAARSAPDGYTLFMGNNSTHASNPVLYSKLPYDPVRDFTPITLMAITTYALIVHPSVPAKSLSELISLAQAKPDQINYASAGNGSTHHLTAELLRWMAGIDIVHVPYKGGPPAITALLSGEVSMLFVNATGVLPHLKNGKARAIAVTTARRSDILPGVPTIAEAALPGFEMLSWFGLLAPAGTPSAIVNRLNGEAVKVLATAEVKAALAAQGQEVMFGSPQQFGEFIRSEIAKIAKIAKATGIKAE